MLLLIILLKVQPQMFQNINLTLGTCTYYTVNYITLSAKSKISQYRIQWVGKKNECVTNYKEHATSLLLCGYHVFVGTSLIGIIRNIARSVKYI